MWQAKHARTFAKHQEREDIMDISDILKIGAEAFQNNTDSSTDGLDLGDISSALAGVMGGSEGKLDLGNLLSGMQGGGLASMAASWLGDGDNDGISPDQVKELLGQQKINEFSSRLGVDQENALSGLAAALPNVIDKSSSGGSILDSVGGLGGVASLAGKLFKK
jgi:uncharacterized protein YidB (DUF937 family)